MTNSPGAEDEQGRGDVDRTPAALRGWTLRSRLRPVGSAASAWMNGCAAAGNRSAEKNTPEKSHIGSITRFIRPLTVSVVDARLAIRSPIPADARATTSNRSTISGKAQVSADRHVEHQACRAGGGSSGRGSGRSAGRPRIASRKSPLGHRGRDEAFQEFADPVIDEQKADPPQPAPHRVDRDQPRDQKVDVAGAGLGDVEVILGRDAG